MAYFSDIMFRYFLNQKIVEFENLDLEVIQIKLLYALRQPVAEL